MNRWLAVVTAVFVAACSGEIGTGAGTDAGSTDRDVSTRDSERPNDGSNPADAAQDTAVGPDAEQDSGPDDTSTERDVPDDTSGEDATEPDDTDTEPDAPEPDVALPDASVDVGEDAPVVEGSLSERYPGDDGLADDPAVLFFDDFETGWGRWDGPTSDTQYLHLETDGALAHAGSGLLRSTVTAAHLDAQQYISSSTRASFPRRVDQVYWRFYAQFRGIAPNPHHWVRMEAGTESYGSSGLANTVPPGDEGFWFDFDVNNNDLFSFYAYWYNMRSGRCNDGTAVDGCEGDQGTTYYYGNTFRPPAQTPFARNQWFCVEIMAKANTVGNSDGELAFWVDNELVEHYRQGNPNGTWLRDVFHTDGCDFSACTDPAPFEGFDFRSSADVRFKRFFLDAYYQRDTFERKKAYLEGLGLVVSDEQTIYYDDVVVATERVGCMTQP